MNLAANEVFQILRSYDYTVQMYDEDATRVYEPENARRFYASPENILVAIVDDGDNSRIRLCFGPSTELVNIRGLIDSLRSCAVKLMMVFKLSPMKTEIKTKDFATLSAVAEGVQGDTNMNLFEGMTGTSKSSYLKLENAQLIVRHSKKIDENAKGARGRNIKSVFVENAHGERFLMPTRQLAPARAMVQHLNQGGSFADQVGEQINRMARDFSSLAQGANYIQQNEAMLSESCAAMRERIVETAARYKKHFAKLARATTYGVESAAICEQASMLTEGKDNAPSAQSIMEMLSIEGVDGLTQEIAEAISTAMIGCDLTEDGQGRFIIRVDRGTYLGVNDDFVNEKGDAVTYTSKEEAHEAAAAAELDTYEVVPQHSTIVDTVPNATVSVMGRPVTAAAWNAFKSGDLGLSEPAPTVELKFSNDVSRTVYMASELTNLMTDDGLINLLSHAVSLMNDEAANPKERRNAYELCKHAVKHGYKTSPLAVSSAMESVMEFASFINSFSVSALFESKSEEDCDLDDCEDDVKDTDTQIVEYALEQLAADFDAADVLADCDADDCSDADALCCCVAKCIADKISDDTEVDVDEDCVKAFLCKNVEILQAASEHLGLDIDLSSIDCGDEEACDLDDDDVDGDDVALTKDDEIIPVDPAADFKHDIGASSDTEDFNRLARLAGIRYS